MRKVIPALLVVLLVAILAGAAFYYWFGREDSPSLADNATETAAGEAPGGTATTGKPAGEASSGGTDGETTANEGAGADKPAAGASASAPIVESAGTPAKTGTETKVEALAETVSEAASKAGALVGKAARNASEAVEEATREAVETIEKLADEARGTTGTVAGGLGTPAKPAGETDSAPATPAVPGQAIASAADQATDAAKAAGPSAPEPVAGGQTKQGGQAETGGQAVAALPQGGADAADKAAGKAAAPSEEGAAPGDDSAVPGPSFDIVRVEQNCEALFAGRAAPGATVTIESDGTVIGTIVADGRGEWVFLPPEPLPAGTHVFSLRSTVDGAATGASAETVTILVPDCAGKGGVEAPETAIAVLTPNAGDAPSKLLQGPPPSGDRSKARALALGAVDYDEEGQVALSGTAEPGNLVRVYIDNRLVGEALVDAEGRWRLRPDGMVEPGVHDLRLDQIGKSGEEADTVVSRINLPFKRAEPGEIRLAVGETNLRVVVQPGNSLWRLARRFYGSGVRYTVIYQANDRQISDPDLIYPGQIFTVPKDKAAGNG
ncbi:LysM peptidoglycan-binding domain-containing protein [Oceanibacterium hippocampi]|uniref:LysM domain/BON superfamily protein n=1 Tax=Oceanibacterium hippocampi TaxID=745714 RepID=A0A1Y5TYZ4_9PROT|nr:LysM peptidoglycan-binding domain-containing protein [Oceanibacterium hippocampi]SLN76853.1 LysM domain/BON superfamily protein [Oceanibacterium hippocampi]